MGENTIPVTPSVKKKKSKAPIIIAILTVCLLAIIIVVILSSSTGDSYIGSWKSSGTKSTITFNISSDNTMVANVNGHTYRGTWSTVDKNNILGTCDGSYFAVQYNESNDTIKVVVTSARKSSSDPLVTVTCTRKGLF